MFLILQRNWNRIAPARRRALRIGSGLFLALLMCWMLVSFLAVYSLTSRSRSRFAEPAPKISGISIEDHRIETADGEEIGIWYALIESHRPTVILIHGNGGDRMSRWPQAEMLLKAGYPVLLISCRAHGDSTGHVNDVGWSARHDVVAAVNWLRKRRPNNPVVVWGASLGAAAAVFAAKELQSKVDGFILECPYRDLETAVWNRMQNNLPILLDRIGYYGLRLAACVVLPEIRQISPINHINTIPETVPVLILAGAADRRARPEEARSLHNAIEQHCHLEIIPRGDHLQLHRTAPRRYERLVLDFLREIQSSRGTP